MKLDFKIIIRKIRGDLIQELLFHCHMTLILLANLANEIFHMLREVRLGKLIEFIVFYYKSSRHQEVIQFRRILETLLSREY